MFAHLQIDDPAERLAVGVADAALWAVTLPRRLRRRPAPAAPARILVLRLERVGDLLMARAGLRLLRRQFPDARIDLVVGAWNAPLARLFPEVDHVQSLDLPWIARGDRPSTLADIASRARAWRKAHYDLGVNFEGDVRSHLLLGASGARRRAGFPQAGGGPLLDVSVPYDPRRHAAWNILVLVARLAGRAPDESDLLVPPLVLPGDATAFAARLLRESALPARLIAVHPSGGRQVKQWPPESLARAAGEVARRRDAALVITGAPADHGIVDAFRAALPSGLGQLDLTGTLDLVQLAAVLQRAELFLGCDSGPMHLAAAVGTPIVAVFGPSDPARWGPLGSRAEAVRIDLPCSPCNRIRKPPLRCRGRVPECLEGVGPDAVIRAAERVLAEHGMGGPHV